MKIDDRVVFDPKVLSGKPVVRGTRLGVDFLLDLMAQGWSQEKILESYPHLTPEDLQAVYRFAAEKIRDEEILPLAKGFAV